MSAEKFHHIKRDPETELAVNPIIRVAEELDEVEHFDPADYDVDENQLHEWLETELNAFIASLEAKPVRLLAKDDLAILVLNSFFTGLEFEREYRM